MASPATTPDRPAATSSTSADRDVSRRGQVFTPAFIVEEMLALRRNPGRVLEPSAGDGAFSRQLPDCVAIEIDARHAPAGAIIGDFFAYPEREQFETIIGNPPYVRFQDIPAATRRRLPVKDFDRRTNLFIYFIAKCLRHLAPGGELIFITPRDFLKATSAVALNERLYALGTITDFIDLGDARLFEDATPNCAIWRFQRDDFSRRTRYRHGELSEERYFQLAGGHLAFTRQPTSVRLGDLCLVKVGAVSGADKLFTHDLPEATDFVCSATARSGKTRRMLFEIEHPLLRPHRKTLLKRKIRKFDDSNWWQWGRRHWVTARPRVYVNCKTRQSSPFFLHPAPAWDGAILALFPHDPAVDITALCAALNAVDWEELGFMCDGRYLFAQRALLEAPLPESFRSFLPATTEHP